MHDGSIFVCVIPLFILFAIGSFMWRANRGKDMLDQWADDHGFEIVSRERRNLLTGPYFLRANKGQDVYYVTVEFPDGQQRSGYVRVGGMFLGMLSDAVDVKWDD